MEIDNWIPWDEALNSTPDNYVLLRIDMRDGHAYAGDKMVHSEVEGLSGPTPVDEIKKVISLMKEDKWTWLANSKCKYISVLVDKTEQRCVLFDRDDNIITLDQFKYQYSSAGLQ